MATDPGTINNTRIGRTPHAAARSGSPAVISAVRKGAGVRLNASPRFRVARISSISRYSNNTGHEFEAGMRPERYSAAGARRELFVAYNGGIRDCEL